MNAWHSRSLVVFAGPSGVGKSTIAKAVAAELCVPVFSVDSIEVALSRAGIEGRHVCRPAAYSALLAMAALQLEVGLSVIADVNAAIPATRSIWPEFAANTQVPLTAIEVTCPDHNVLQQRLEIRHRDVPEPSWAQVLHEHETYQPWERAELQIDSRQSVADNVRTIISHLTDLSEGRAS